MACMEHECVECSWTVFNNKSVFSCPKCGGECTSIFDEEGDHYEQEDEEE